MRLHHAQNASSWLLVGLNDQGLVDVRDHTTAGDGGLDQRVELLVASDGEQQVSRSDSLDLEVLGRVTGELKHLGSQVLEDGGRVDGRGSADSAVGTDPGLEESVDPSNWELECVSGLLNRQMQHRAPEPKLRDPPQHEPVVSQQMRRVDSSVRRQKGLSAKNKL